MTNNSGNKASSSNPTGQSPRNTIPPTGTETLIRPTARSPTPRTSQPPPAIDLRPTQPPPPPMGVAGVTAFRVVTSSPPGTVAHGVSGTLIRPIAHSPPPRTTQPPPPVDLRPTQPPPPPMGVAGVTAFRSLRNAPPETGASSGSSQPTGAVGPLLPPITTSPPPAVSQPPTRPGATTSRSFNLRPPSETKERGGSSGGLNMTGSSSGVGGSSNLVFQGTRAIPVGGSGSGIGGLSIGAGSSTGRKEVLHNQLFSGLIPFKCLVCKSPFENLQHLFAHMKSHGWGDASPTPTINNPPAAAGGAEGVALHNPPAAGGGAEGVALNDPPAAAGGEEGVALNNPPAAVGGAEDVALHNPPAAGAEGALNNPLAAAAGGAEGADAAGNGGREDEEEEENYLLPNFNVFPELEDGDLRF